MIIRTKDDPVIQDLNRKLAECRQAKKEAGPHAQRIVDQAGRNLADAFENANNGGTITLEGI